MEVIYVLQTLFQLINSKDDIARISVDGAYFRTYEPTPFSLAWYSFKHNVPGIRYEVFIGIRTARITSINGPFPCGSYPDLKIFRNGIKSYVDKSEMVIADKGYPDSTVYHDNELQKFESSRYEHIN